MHANNIFNYFQNIPIILQPYSDIDNNSLLNVKQYVKLLVPVYTRSIKMRNMLIKLFLYNITPGHIVRYR